MSNGNGNEPLTSAVVSDVTSGAAKAALRGYVDQYVERGEINTTRFTTGVREAMVQFLLDRGVDIDNEALVDAGVYDEHFVTAYENAITFLDGSNDPVDAARRAPSAAAVTWDFEVDTFDDLDLQGIIPDNVRAAGAV